MKKILALMLFTVLAVNPVFAQQGNKHDGMKQGGMMGNGSEMGMMDGEHMKTMKKFMKAIQKADDPEKRRELMKEHHEAMQAHMQSMKSMMSEHTEHEGEPVDSGTRMERMERQTRMMQGMMEQMMKRDAVTSK